MLVICLEGPHGVGKTSMLTKFRELGLPVMDEGFLDMPHSKLHPQSLTMETRWVSGWFARLLERAEREEEERLMTDEDRERLRKSERKLPPEKRREETIWTSEASLNDMVEKGGKLLFGSRAKKRFIREKVLVCDRSPLSAVFYSKPPHGQNLIKPLVDVHLSEIKSACDVTVKLAVVGAERDVLWGRVESRLERERDGGDRLALGEGERTWLDTVCDFYDSLDSEPDLEVVRVDNTEEDCIERRCLELLYQCASDEEFRSSLDSESPARADDANAAFVDFEVSQDSNASRDAVVFVPVEVNVTAASAAPTTPTTPVSRRTKSKGTSSRPVLASVVNR